MQAPATPDEEIDRLASLERLQVMDTPSEARFDRITQIALKVFKVPISTVTLVDSTKEWYKSCQGVASRQQDRTISFCAHAILSDDPLIIEDASKDSRFKDNPMVTGLPHIRFYAGIPVHSVDGKRVGAFCIKDTKSRGISQSETHLLQVLASWVEIELNLNELKKILQNFKERKLENLDKTNVNMFLQRLSDREVIDSLRLLKVDIRTMLNEDERVRFGIDEQVFDQLKNFIFALQDILEDS